LSGAGLATHCFVLAFLVGAFWRRLIGPGLLASACHWNLLRCFSDTCRSGFGRGGVGPWQHDPLGARGSTRLRGSAHGWG
jgi:hypothetical protein